MTGGHEGPNPFSPKGFRDAARYYPTAVPGSLSPGQYTVAQFIGVCSRAKLGYMRKRKYRRGSPLCTRWALKQRGDAQLFSQFLRATNCDKLSVFFCGAQVCEALHSLVGKAMDPFAQRRIGKMERVGDRLEALPCHDIADSLGATEDMGLLGPLQEGV